jgi:succinyl-diaminopimelate desuccinylase
MLSLTPLLEQLIACPSITPVDAGCQTLLTDQLTRLGFEIEHFPFGNVNNFWAKRGKTAPLFVFAGHTDVVPPGPLDQWHSPPFVATKKEGLLYGRGSADMKGSLAAMFVACERFIHEHPNHSGSLAWLITSDEEGPSIDGTAKVIEALNARGEKIDYCLVGEPTSNRVLGDTLKIGRRGSLSGHLQIYGRQSHIAYTLKDENPIHATMKIFAEALDLDWDNNQHAAEFQATSFQLSNQQAGTGATNVVPGHSETRFNFRYSPVTTAETIQTQFENLIQKQNLKKHGLDYKLTWQHGGKPFMSVAGKLRQNTALAIEEIVGITPQFSTSGGVSDARFIAATGAEVIELGPINQSIHQINEHVSLKDLETLTHIYATILKKILI